MSDVNGVNVVRLCRSEAGRLVADEALFEARAVARFREMTVPFESGTLLSFLKPLVHLLALAAGAFQGSFVP